MLHDGGKVIAGLAIFVILVAFPVIYNAGNAGDLPNPEKPAKELNVTVCVEDTQFMRTSHMQLLSDWRDQVLRDGDRKPIVVAGKEYDKSLQNTCMKCHTSKKKFCDECHNYASVAPYCWDCHIQPKEEETL